MLFFELFPAFLLIILIPIGIWLFAMDRQARRQEPPDDDEGGPGLRPSMRV